MTAPIPETKITEIQNAADIVDIVSDSVVLKKTGKDFVGLCPFHSEKTPSFTVSPAKQIFHCFGCGEGGTVFGFLMKHDGLSFPEAVKVLGARYGIEVADRDLPPEERKRLRDRERLLSANEAAMGYFTACLHDRIGEKAAAYLRNRGIDRGTIDRFHLGFAPEGWDNLIRRMAKSGFKADILERCGLVAPSKPPRRGHYDRFRNRIIFPIIDGRRRVVGFGGRVMDDGMPKYLNTPETAVFDKGRSLYGLSVTRSKCLGAGSAFLVEGYFDLISLYQAGIENTVATLGTALTAHHVRLLKGVSERVILVFDSDTAGIKAAARAIEIFDREGGEASILVLPRGHDPDSFVRSEGPDRFRELADAAVSPVEFLMSQAIRKWGDGVEGKVRILSEMKRPLGAIRDPVKRSLYIKNLSERIGVDEERIAEAVIPSRSAVPDRRAVPPAAARSEGVEKGGRLERKIVSMMLQYPEIIPEIERRGLLGRFRDPALRSIGESVLARPGHPVARMDRLIADERKARMAVSLAMEGECWDREGCLRLLGQFESLRLRGEDRLLKEIEAAERGGDQSLLLKLLEERQNQARRVSKD